MAKYQFNKKGIKEMYDNTLEDIYKALVNNEIDKMNIHIKIGEHEIEIPNNADYFEMIMATIKECEED